MPYELNERAGSVNSGENFFVITGGPGSGKSSLIEALRGRGYPHSVEAGRGIIKDQVMIGGHALPWDNRSLFAELMLCREIRSYHLASESRGTVFFDRGVPDVLGYLRLSNLAVPGYMQKAAELFRYNQRVFIAPPWKEIFQPDRERKQDFAEAVRTYGAMVAIYSDLDYQLVEIPCVPIEERVEFILNEVGRIT